MKRFLAALMAAVLALTLCACGADAPAETAPPVTAELTASPTPVPTVAVETPTPEPEDTALVRVRDYIPDIWVDLRYAGEDNFTGAAIYDFSDAYLRYGTVRKLAAVQETLRGEGLSLLIWDAYRPQYAQRLLWGDVLNGYSAPMVAARSTRSGCCGSAALTRTSSQIPTSAARSIRAAARWILRSVLPTARP